MMTLSFLLLFPVVVCVQEFIEEPSNIEINPGEDLVLPCLIRNKAGECRWEKDGTPVGMFEDKYEWSGNVLSGDCGLVIRDASVEYDTGMWLCQVTASNFTQKDTLISREVMINVRVSPKTVVIRKMANMHGTPMKLNDKIECNAGEVLNLKCESSGGNPAAKLEWKVNGIIIKSSKNIISQLADGSWRTESSITLPISKNDHNALIVCQVDHQALTSTLMSEALLNVMFPPVVSSLTKPLKPFVEGDSVTLLCDAISNPPARVTWKRIDYGKSLLIRDSVILLPSVSRKDAGTYQCEAENELGISQPSLQTIDVLYPPMISKTLPSNQINVTTHSKVSFICLADSNPPPTYMWLQKLPSGEVVVRGYDSKLLIRSVGFEHMGEFVCKASNIVRGIKKKAQSESIAVNVRGPPHLEDFKVLREVIVQSGETIIIEVPFCSNPSPTTNWIIKLEDARITLPTGTRYLRILSMTTSLTPASHCYKSVLTIENASPSDSKEYTLKICNAEGEVSIDVTIIVINETLSLEIVVSIVVGGVLSILIISLVILYSVQARRSSEHFKNTKSVAGSDKTDVESHHSIESFQKRVSIPTDSMYSRLNKSNLVKHEKDSSRTIQHDPKPDLLST